MFGESPLGDFPFGDLQDKNSSSSDSLNIIDVITARAELTRGFSDSFTVTDVCDYFSDLTLNANEQPRIVDVIATPSQSISRDSSEVFNITDPSQNTISAATYGSSDRNYLSDESGNDQARSSTSSETLNAQGGNPIPSPANKFSLLENLSVQDSILDDLSVTGGAIEAYQVLDDTASIQSVTIFVSENLTINDPSATARPNRTINTIENISVSDAPSPRLSVSSAYSEDERLEDTEPRVIISGSITLESDEVGTISDQAVFFITKPDTNPFVKPNGPFLPYLYNQYKDSDELQILFEAARIVHTRYYEQIVNLSLPVWTKLTGDLLDYVALNIYGFYRPSLIFGIKFSQEGVYNTVALNTTPFNSDGTEIFGTNYTANDDFFKRILTWNLYVGDGYQFSTSWLKRRVNRFLLGQNGSDPILTTRYTISVVFQGSGEVRIRIPNLYGDSAKILQAAIAQNLLTVPFQFNILVELI